MGIPESDFTQVAGGLYGVARVPITATSHTIDSAKPFGITVYGFATFTSYMYPGGLDLEFINPVE